MEGDIGITKFATCIGCGCTDERACISKNKGPCHWLAVDYVLGEGVCSRCPEKLDEFRELIKEENP